MNSFDFTQALDACEIIKTICESPAYYTSILVTQDLFFVWMLLRTWGGCANTAMQVNFSSALNYLMKVL